MCRNRQQCDEIDGDAVCGPRKSADCESHKLVDPGCFATCFFQENHLASSSQLWLEQDFTSHSPAANKQLILFWKADASSYCLLLQKGIHTKLKAQPLCPGPCSDGAPSCHSPTAKHRERDILFHLVRQRRQLTLLTDIRSACPKKYISWHKSKVPPSTLHQHILHPRVWMLEVRDFCIAAAAMSSGGRWAPWWKEERRQRKCFAGKASSCKWVLCYLMLHTIPKKWPPDSFISTSFDISPLLRCKLGQQEFVWTYLIKHIVQISLDSTNFHKGFMLMLGGHVKNTTCVAMSPNGQWVVSGKGVSEL